MCNYDCFSTTTMVAWTPSPHPQIYVTRTLPVMLFLTKPKGTAHQLAMSGITHFIFGSFYPIRRITHNTKWTERKQFSTWLTQLTFIRNLIWRWRVAEGETRVKRDVTVFRQIYTGLYILIRKRDISTGTVAFHGIKSWETKARFFAQAT